MLDGAWPIGAWMGNGRMVVVATVGFAALCACFLLLKESDRIVDQVIRPLERRFEHADIRAPDRLIGLIVLAGSNKRLSEAGQLARRYSHLRIVVSGAQNISDVFPSLGGRIDPSRLLLEPRSSNTYENALYSMELINPKPGDRWLLVTSAWHMPRSIAAFRKVGFEVEAWPVKDPIPRNYRLYVALREWFGLVVYRLLGKTNALFPAPWN